MGRRSNTLEDFHTKYLVDVQTQCWKWQGHKDKRGYGKWRWRSKNWPAHRISMLIDGNDPQGYQVNHHCDNPSCVNPQHLYLGTQQDNMRDRTVRGRTHNKLTQEQVLSIRADTDTYRTIGKKYNVTHDAVYKIKKRKTWAHI